MSLEELCARTSREAPSGPMRETSIAPTLLTVCCSCRLIRDVTGPRPDDVRWVTQRTYCETHRINPADFPLTHAYCPECFAKVQDSMSKYFREIGALS
jgi:hypothetical protein